LLIDAVDNAELIARERSERSFPVLLLESLHDNPVSGVRLIISCRTERKPTTYARYQEFPLRPFGINETEAYLKSRLPDVSQVEITVAQARSGGNPRVLEYLVKSGRGLLDGSEIDKAVELDDLIEQRLMGAVAMAFSRGSGEEDMTAFLAGLAVLPPPVPLDEYAGAQGIPESAVESFAADLRPLLERTSQGLMFRDEPTETLVCNRYASSKAALRRLAANLLARQNVSVYAARSLPHLLHRLNDGQQLFELAFDDRTPAAITGTVGKRNIRFARLVAAVRHAAINSNYNRLVPLLVELSTLAAVDQRGMEYILDNPDLAVAARDVDAIRRLFEARTAWPGARHARLAIANVLSGEPEEATRHAIATSEWLHHYRNTIRDDRRQEAGPGHSDVAAIPTVLIRDSRPERALAFLRGWNGMSLRSARTCLVTVNWLNRCGRVHRVALRDSSAASPV
jgi:hypothetical protein